MARLTGKIVKADPLSMAKFYLCDCHSIRAIDTSEEVHVGQSVTVEGQEKNGVVMVEKMLPSKPVNVEKFFEVKFKQPKPLVDSAVMQHLQPHFNEAAHALAKAVLELRQIKLRYDGDGDGILAALTLKKGIENFAEKKNVPLQLRCVQSDRGYPHHELQEDLSQLLEGSLLVFLDMGSTDDVREHVCEAGKKLEIMVIDHHPPDKSLPAKTFVSPFQTDLKEPSSNYNSGLLAYEVARRLAPELDAQIRDYAVWSMEADHSQYAEREGDASRVVSYLSVVGEQPRQLDQYEKILADKGKIKELAREEGEKMQRALEKALKKVKLHHFGEMLFIQGELSSAVVKKEYPSRGRLTNYVHDYFADRHTEPVISICYDDTSLSFRATQSAIKQGFTANKVITALKKEFHNQLTGGGHDAAAGLRYPKTLAKSVVQRTIEIIREQNG